MTALFILAAAAGFRQEYLGRWGEGLAGCSPGAIHGGLTIERKTITDGEFSGIVQSVKRKPNRSIDVTERWNDLEDGPKTFVTNYRLSKDTKSLRVRESGENSKTQTLIRCKVSR